MLECCKDVTPALGRPAHHVLQGNFHAPVTAAAVATPAAVDSERLPFFPERAQRTGKKRLVGRVELLSRVAGRETPCPGKKILAADHIIYQYYFFTIYNYYLFELLSYYYLTTFARMVPAVIIILAKLMEIFCVGLHRQAEEARCHHRRRQSAPPGPGSPRQRWRSCKCRRPEGHRCRSGNELPRRRRSGCPHGRRVGRASPMLMNK